MFNLSEQVRGGTFCFAKCGLAVSSNTAKMKLDNPDGSGYTNFCINGIMYSVADGADLAVFTAASQAALTTCLYLVCIDSANTITVVKGQEVLTASLSGGIVTLQWPTPTVDTCPIGAVKIVATAIFTAGTTALGTGNAATYYSLFAVPDKPITA